MYVSVPMFSDTSKKYNCFKASCTGLRDLKQKNRDGIALIFSSLGVQDGLTGSKWSCGNHGADAGIM